MHTHKVEMKDYIKIQLKCMWLLKNIKYKRSLCILNFVVAIPYII